LSGRNSTEPFKLYYYSSSYPANQFTLNWRSAASFEIYSLNMLSTNDALLLACGENYSRIEKTDIVSQWPFSYKYLNVCIIHQSDIVDRNCSRCGKCQRTLVTLDILGKIDQYNDVFDLDDYYKNRKKYFASVILGEHRNLFQKDVNVGIRLPTFVGVRLPTFVGVRLPTFVGIKFPTPVSLSTRLKTNARRGGLFHAQRSRS
jgi:transcription elongation factor Elf1